MAIAYDASSAAKVTASSLTFAHSCAGNNRVLLVYVFHASGGNVITGITYAGAALTKLGEHASDARLEIWYRINPATSANNIIVSTGASQQLHACGVSYKGVLQSGFPDNSKSTDYNASGTALSGSITPVADNAWVVALGHVQDGSPSASEPNPSTNTLERISIRDDSAQRAIGVYEYDSNPIVTPAATSQRITKASTGQLWLYLVTLEPAPGWSNIAKVNGVISVDFAKFNGASVVDVAKVNGVTV